MDAGRLIGCVERGGAVRCGAVPRVARGGAVPCRAAPRNATKQPRVHFTAYLCKTPCAINDIMLYFIHGVDTP